MPTLTEILSLMGSHEVWVEVKAMPARYDERLLRVLADGPSPAQYAVHSFDHRIIRRLGQRRPDLRRGVLMSAYVLDPLAILEGAAASTLWQEQSMVDDELVAAVHGAGCDACGFTGYHGSIGVFEVMPLTNEITRELLAGAPPSRIREVAVSDGMHTLLQHALKLVADRVTTIDEVRRAL